jgi:hypothetical protein
MCTANTILSILSVLLLLNAGVSSLPVEARSKNADSFFSAPDTAGKEIPSFKDRPQSAQNSTGMVSAEGEMPRQDIINSLPSLTEPQRKAIRELFDQSRKAVQPLNDQIGVLEKQVKLATDSTEKKATALPNTALKNAVPANASSTNAAAANATALKNAVPANASSTNAAVANATALKNAVPASASSTNAAVANSTASKIAVAPNTIPSTAAAPESAQLPIEVLNAELSGLKQAVKDGATKLSHQIAAILTASQVSELEAMRRGTLIIGKGGDSMPAGAAAPARQNR